MRSQTAALLWEIWRRHRVMFVAVVALTVTGRLLDFSQQATGGASSADVSVLVELLQMVSFLLLFAVFNYTESGGSRELGPFPHRLFTLPVSSLRLVTIPVLTGLVSVEVLYLLWMAPLSAGTTGSLFDALLLGALMVLYQATLWTLAGLGALRLLFVGLEVVVLFGAGLLPSLAPTPPPMWRSEGALTMLVAGIAVVVFLAAWRHVARARCGGGHRVLRVDAVVAAVMATLPRRRRAFASPADAHFWFEWRCSGLVLPLLVGGVLLAVVAPLSWLSRHDAGDTLRALIGTLAVPVLLAIPVGMGFARPTFWSEDLSLPAFIAVRPLTDEEIVAIKVKVAAASVAISWLLLITFVGVWLTAWANLDSLSRLAIQLWAFHDHSMAVVYGIAVLIVMAGMVLTWRLLVSRLWSGLSGRRPLFVASAVSVALAVIGGLVFDVTRFPGWVLEDPDRMKAVAWMLAVAVVAKYWLAAYAWRRVAAPYAWRYLLVWCAGTACFAVLAMVFWGIVRIYVALDIYRFQSVVILLALLAVPLARIGLAPSSLARNRHR